MTIYIDDRDGKRQFLKFLSLSVYVDKKREKETFLTVILILLIRKRERDVSYYLLHYISMIEIEKDNF